MSFSGVTLFCWFFFLFGLVYTCLHLMMVFFLDLCVLCLMSVFFCFDTWCSIVEFWLAVCDSLLILIFCFVFFSFLF